MTDPLMTTEGIILRMTPYGDFKQILTLFTPENGVIKVIEKGGRKAKRFEPLTKVELVYSEGRGEISHCNEMHVIDAYSHLRSDLLYLEVACDMIQAVLSSQYAEKTAFDLYTLFCIYLKNIARMPYPWVLAASFRLKLLKHDGLIAFPFSCSACEKILDAGAYMQGELGWCGEHKSAYSLFFEEKELKHLYLLANCESLAEVSVENISSYFMEKITFFFRSCISN